MRKRIVLLALLLLLSGCGQPTAATTDTREATTAMTSIERQSFSCDALFFGDSITADGNFDELFPELKTVNLGVYGDTLAQLLRRVPEVRDENPARIILLGGINSLRPDNVERCLEQYSELLEALKSACPEAELCVQSVLPVAKELDPDGRENDAVRRFNEALERLAAEQGCAFADLYAVYEKDGFLDPALTRDGIHLNFNAYGPWAETITPYLK